MSSITADASESREGPSIATVTLWLLAVVAAGPVSLHVVELLMSLDIYQSRDPSCHAAILGCLGMKVLGEYRVFAAAAFAFIAFMASPMAYLATIASCAIGLVQGSRRRLHSVVAFVLLAPFLWMHVAERWDFARLDRTTSPVAAASDERAALPLFVVADLWSRSPDRFETYSDERARFIGQRLRGVRMTVASEVEGRLYVGREIASGDACASLLASGGEWKDIGDGVCATPHDGSVLRPDPGEARIVEILDDPSPFFLSSGGVSGSSDADDPSRPAWCYESWMHEPFPYAARVVVDAGSPGERTYGAGCRLQPTMLPFLMGDGFVHGIPVPYTDEDPTDVIEAVLAKGSGS